MEITDIDGRTIIITDLEQAFQQAEVFKHYRHQDKEYAALDIKLQAYWSDIYDKLYSLKAANTKKSG